MGSEFAYEDMSSFEIEKYSFKYLGEERCDEDICYIIESQPKEKYSGYSKQITWLDKAHYRVHKINLYDRKKSLLKTLNLSDYHQYQNKYWRAHQAVMSNHLTGKSTQIIISDLTFDIGLTDKDFNKNVLKRAK